MCGVALMTNCASHEPRAHPLRRRERSRIMQGFGPKMRIEASYRSEKQRIFEYEKCDGVGLSLRKMAN
jgi:hypothetical protein